MVGFLTDGALQQRIKEEKLRGSVRDLAASRLLRCDRSTPRRNTLHLQ